MDVGPASSRERSRSRASGPILTDGGQVEAETDEGDGADDEETDEAESDESDGNGVDDEDGDDEDSGDESHVQDAEDVYQGDDASGVLHLDLDGLFLDLLGLEVNLNPVTLDVSARPGENNLLGNLLSTVTGLLDGPSAVLEKVKSALEKPINVLKSALGKPKELLQSAAGTVTSPIRSLLGKPKALLSGLFSSFGDEDEAEDEERTEEADDSQGRLSRLAGWLKSKLFSLVPSLPVEELVARVVSEIIRQLAEQVEPQSEQDDSSGQSNADSTPEAQS